MIKPLFKIQLILMPLVFLFSACVSFHSGSISSGPLLKATDQYVSIASGEAKQVNVLFLFEKTHPSLLLEAKKEMFKNRPLKKGEYYSNITSEVVKKIYFGIVFSTKARVSADVLGPCDTLGEPMSKSYAGIVSPDPIKTPAGLIKEDTPKTSNGNILLNGDSVYFSASGTSYYLYVVTSLDKSSAILKSMAPGAKNVLVTLDRQFYFKNLRDGEYKHGDKIVAEFSDVYNATVSEEGIVLGSNSNFYLVFTKSGYHVASANRLRRK